ncbi:MAG TPA: ABC transporter permease [Actinomycetota bacterium]|nr:ABC transporter permease [Actinomycetota bacterium]
MSAVVAPRLDRQIRARSFLRTLLIGGMIAYRALFNWIRPSIYIPTMLGGPLFQILFFAYLGRFSGVADDTFFVVGNAVQVCSMSSIYGATMTLANERYFGTLSSLLATPANRFAIFLGRTLPVIANGLLVSAFGFVVGMVLLDFRLPAAALPPLALVVIVTVVSCTGLGMLLGSIGLRMRDVFFASNLAYFIILLFCGVNVPLSALPEWMQTVGRMLPVTHGIAAARLIARGASLGAVDDLVRTELLIAAAYAVASFGLFRYFEISSRRTASLEKF